MTSNEVNFNSHEAETPAITKEDLPDTIGYLAPQLGNAALEAVLSAHNITASPNTVRGLLGLEITEPDILADTEQAPAPAQPSSIKTEEGKASDRLAEAMQRMRAAGSEGRKAGIGNHGNW